MSFELAHKEVIKLVHAFQTRESYYLSSDYHEFEVRKECIGDFFIALGWGVGSKKSRDTMQGNMFQIDKEPLLQIPIYKTEDNETESKQIQLVDKMIELKQLHATTLSDSHKESIANQIKSTDYHIDKLVYGLSEEEVRIVEN